MSTQTINPAAAGELAAAQRVAQLQALMAAAAQFGSGAPTASAPAPASDFASALQAATGAEGGVANSSYQPGVASAGASSEGGQFEALIQQAAARNGLDPAVLHGLIQQESAFDPSSTSSAGAEGLTQLMPGTASSMGVANPLNPAESIEGGARYLGQLMSQFGGNTTDALAAYNAGPGAVSHYGGVPPYAETESYVTKVLGYAEAFRQSHPTTNVATAPTGVLT